MKSREWEGMTEDRDGDDSSRGLNKLGGPHVARAKKGEGNERQDRKLACVRDHVIAQLGADAEFPTADLTLVRLHEPGAGQHAVHPPAMLVDGLARDELFRADVALQSCHRHGRVNVPTMRLVFFHVLLRKVTVAVRALGTHVGRSAPLVDAASLTTIQLLRLVHQVGDVVAFAVHDGDVFEELVAEALLAAHPAVEHQRTLALQSSESDVLDMLECVAVTWVCVVHLTHVFV